MERWSATENVTGALERSETKGWSATVLELRKTSWSAEKLRKIGWSAEHRYVLERWRAERKRGGALERYERRAGALERCYPRQDPFLHTGGWRSTVGHIRNPYTIPEGVKSYHY